MTTVTLEGLSGLVVFGENAVNAAPMLIDPEVAFAGGAGGTLTVSGLLPEDVLSIRNEGTGAGEIGYLAGTLSFGGIPIGSASGGQGSDLVVSFGPTATAEAIGAVIENLTYANGSDAPTVSRTLTIHFADSSASDLAPVILETRSGSSDPFDGIAVDAGSNVAFGDLDGDGDLDMLVGTSVGEIAFFENTGSATQPAFTQRSGSDNPFAAIASFDDSIPHPGLADLDGDGDLDLAFGQASGSVIYSENTGTAVSPTFGAGRLAFSVGSSAAPAAADLDGDGDLDAVVGNAVGHLAFFKNVGSATEGEFSKQIGASDPFEGIDVGDQARPTFADTDGDGDFDLAVGAADGTVSFFENTGTATAPVFVQRTGAANPFDGIDVGNQAAPTFVDLDGDGDIDAVVAGDGGALTYLENVATLRVVVQISPENDPPKITSLGGGPTADAMVAENGAFVTTVAAADPDNTPAFSIAGGADAARFVIDAASGALSFKSAPDFEQPGDVGGDNVYDVVVRVSDGTAVADQAIAVTVSDVAGLTILGAKTADVLAGSAEADTVSGRGGKDRLSGLGGDDVLDGGRGKDKLIGGDGADSFVFADKLKANVDKVLDFEAGTDTFVLDGAIFRKLAPGTLADEAFAVGGKAKDAHDRIVYDDASGRVLYDADGKGGRDAVVFAKIGKHLDVDASDFMVI
ncbi:MAG: VCBS repeat-containing protein [Bauldia sp.]|nr:VCBS repeat-containing protein [Bauldia sp.]